MEAKSWPAVGLKARDHDVAARQNHSHNHAKKKASSPRKEENPDSSMVQNIIHKILLGPGGSEMSAAE